MKFEDFVGIIYIRGYGDKQEPFIRKLLENSVEQKSLLVVSEAALKGYIRGDNIGSLAVMMFTAKVRPDLIKSSLESLYDCKHKDTKTYNDRYGRKLYKEALFATAKASGHFPDLTRDNLSETLAQCLYGILQAAKEEAGSHIQHSDSAITKDIDASLCSLIAIGHKIADSEFSLPLHIQTDRTHNFRLALQNEFQHLISLATSLSSSEDAKDIPDAASIVDTIFNLTPDDFILSEFEYRLEWKATENIHKLERLLLSARNNKDSNEADDADGTPG